MELNLKNSKGFTLVELMIAMAVALIVMAGVYITYDYQSESYEKQAHISELNTHLNGAFFFMNRDIMMAGYDPLYDPTTTIRARATITDAGIDTIQFQYDMNSDGTLDDDETVRLLMVNNKLVRREYDANNLIIPVHEENLAEHIEFLEFCYVMDNGTAMTPVNNQDLRDRIRAVLVSAIFRTAKPIKGQKEIEEARSIQERADLYVQASSDLELVPNFSGTRPAPWDPPIDRYARKLRIIRIKPRNMGITGAALGY